MLTLLVIFMTISLTSCSKLPFGLGGKDKAEIKSEVTKEQGKTDLKGNEYQESDQTTGSNVDESKSTTDLKTPASVNTIKFSGTYPNGKHGYHTVIAPNDLTNGIDPNRQEGITTDGKYYYKKSDVDKCQPYKAFLPVYIGGPMFMDESSKEWQYKEAGTITVNGIEFYFVQAPNNKPIPEANGNYRMCAWYFDSDYYYPHQGVKKGVSKIIENTVR